LVVREAMWMWGSKKGIVVSKGLEIRD
jgi:hypothetical protein